MGFWLHQIFDARQNKNGPFLNKKYQKNINMFFVKSFVLHILTATCFSSDLPCHEYRFPRNFGGKMQKHTKNTNRCFMRENLENHEIFDSIQRFVVFCVFFRNS